MYTIGIAEILTTSYLAKFNSHIVEPKNKHTKSYPRNHCKKKKSGLSYSAVSSREFVKSVYTPITTHYQHLHAHSQTILYIASLRIEYIYKRVWIKFSSRACRVVITKLANSSKLKSFVHDWLYEQYPSTTRERKWEKLR